MLFAHAIFYYIFHVYKIELCTICTSVIETVNRFCTHKVQNTRVHFSRKNFARSVQRRTKWSAEGRWIYVYLHYVIFVCAPFCFRELVSCCTLCNDLEWSEVFVLLRHSMLQPTCTFVLCVKYKRISIARALCMREHFVYALRHHVQHAWIVIAPAPQHFCRLTFIMYAETLTRTVLVVP